MIEMNPQQIRELIAKTSGKVWTAGRPDGTYTRVFDETGRMIVERCEVEQRMQDTSLHNAQVMCLGKNVLLPLMEENAQLKQALALGIGCVVRIGGKMNVDAVKFAVPYLLNEKRSFNQMLDIVLAEKPA